MSCSHAPRLGAYALGVDDPERRVIEDHLAACAYCRAELSDLGEVVAMLTTARFAGVGEIDLGANPETEPETDPDVEPGEEAVPSPELGQGAGPATLPDELSDDLLNRVLAAIATERTDHRTAKVTAIRRRRRRVALGIAAAVALGGSVAGVAVARGELLTPDHAQLTASRSTYGVTATTNVRDDPWGTQIDMALHGLPPLTSCRLVAKAHDGRTETVASWRVTYDDGLEVEGISQIRATELAELQVIDTTGRLLLTVTATPIERINQ